MFTWPGPENSLAAHVFWSYLQWLLQTWKCSGRTASHRWEWEPESDTERYWKEATKPVFSSTTHVCAQPLSLTNTTWCWISFLSIPGVEKPSSVSWVDGLPLVVVDTQAAAANSRPEKGNKRIFMQSKVVFSDTLHALRVVEKRAKLLQNTALLGELAALSSLGIPLHSLLKCPAGTGLGKYQCPLLQNFDCRMKKRRHDRKKPSLNVHMVDRRAS